MRTPSARRPARIYASIAACGLTLFAICAVGAPKRALEVDDFDRLLAVDNLACSRDGRWIAYTVEGSDLEVDERRSSVWMADFDGTTDLRLTAGGDSVSSPQFSPDGRYVSFLSARAADGRTQLYLLDRRGGEAQPLSGAAGDVADYAWSPEGGRLVISMAAGADESDKAKSPAPMVIDRLHFKEDRTGYLTAADRTQLYLYDLAAKKLTPLTTDRDVDDTAPVFSPDGKSIAFISNRSTDADRSGRLEVDFVEARSGATPRKLAEFFAPNHSALLWTRDGTRLVYTSGLEPRLNSYIQDRLSVVAVADAKPRILTERLDRALAHPAMTADDGAVDAIIEDDGSEVPVTVRLDTGRTERLVDRKLSATSLCSAGGHVAVVASTDSSVPEVYAVENAGLRRLTHHNDAVLDELSLGSVEDISFPSRDGTVIHGMMVKPPNFQAGRTYPTLLWIHGGPNGQATHGLAVDTDAEELERQWFATHGYVVLGVNYRGSSGRGAAFAQAIFADWGNKEVADLEAAVDYAVREKVADPNRLGVGGWSYGGILTDYLIASDTRFKAAISGAGSGNQISMYGTDEYSLQDNAELKPPWQSTGLWLRVSYPFFHADRIKTPTLFLGGDKDFNVPVAGGEQMYLALRTLGVPTQLIVYPGQYHLLTRPSYIRDRLRRYLEWVDRYLKPPAG
jgi:dipeptidyl aminopeptidase/acylaminoacyl peptidase